MTAKHRTVWMIVLAVLAWLPVAIWNIRLALNGVSFHGYEPAMFWWRLAIIEGGIVAGAAIGLFVGGIKQRQMNLSAALAAVAATWFLVEWLPLATEGLLRSWKLIT